MDLKSFKKKLYIIIFESDTKAGKRFDVILLWFILFSIALVMLESIESVKSEYGEWLTVGEWFVTIVFTVEYALRVWVNEKPWSYIFSFFGIVDLLATFPTYLSLFIRGAGGIIAIRAFRLLRVFKIFGLNRFTKEAIYIIQALKDSRQKLGVFFSAILITVIILGSIMYMVEGKENGYSSIPESIYWAIVTMTTVGYGDIAPKTDLGKFISSFIMILGYTIIAVPTGIISVSFNRKAEKKRKKNKKVNLRVCTECKKACFNEKSNFCNRCGEKLPEIITYD